MGRSPNKPTGPNLRGHTAPQEVDESAAHRDLEAIEAIGAALQAYYQALVDEPVPSRFIALLAELESMEGGGE
jgi:hypothetical protein